jgi:hypothetical protein
VGAADAWVTGVTICASVCDNSVTAAGRGQNIPLVELDSRIEFYGMRDMEAAKAVEPDRAELTVRRTKLMQSGRDVVTFVAHA